MTQADRVFSTPPTNTSVNSVTTHPDPVVILSNQLLDLWRADDASELEYSGEESLKLEGKEIQNQLIEWREAVTNIISYTQAKSLAGALVQMAIALDEFDSLLARVGETGKRHDLHEFRISRLVQSAMCAVRESVGSSEIESVRALVSIYPSDEANNLLDRMPQWAAEGRALRESERE